MASWDTYDHSRYRYDDSYNKPRRSRNDSTYASHMLPHVPASATNTLLASTPPIMTISNHFYTPPYLREPGVAHPPRAETTVEHHAGGPLRRMLKMRKTRSEGNTSLSVHTMTTSRQKAPSDKSRCLLTCLTTFPTAAMSGSLRQENRPTHILRLRATTSELDAAKSAKVLG